MNALGHPLMRPLAATAALFVIWAAWTVWGERHAARLMDGLSVGPGKAHYLVTLDFPPEGFHVTRLQAIGRVIEVKGPTVYLMDVDPTVMRDFATAYWVREVRTWPGR